MREQRVILQLVLLAVFVIVLVLRLAGWLDGTQSLLIVFATLAAATALAREYLRTVLFAYRRPQDVFRADATYVMLLLLGVTLASLAMNAALYSTLALAVAAAASAILLWRSVFRSEPWNPHGARGVLRTFVPLGTWSVSGAAAYWALSQGYSFIVAGTLDVQAVATIAVSRLPFMPLNLISAGLAVQLLPIAADWVHSLGVRVALRRLALVSVALMAFACCYFVLVWIFRERIFTDLFHKSFPQRDELLLLWFVAFMLMLVRDQLVKLLIARERFPALASTTVTSAVLSLLIGYAATLHFGEVGAVAGILCGELANIAGIVVLTLRELKRAVPAPA